MLNESELAFVIGAVLSVLYFPLGFYTLRSTDIGVRFSFIYGVVLSLSLVSIIFSLMKLDISILLLFILLIIFLLIVIIEAFAIKFLDQPNGKIIKYNNGLIVRYLAVFVLMIWSVLSYNYQ